MSIISHKFAFVVGVDTHARNHVYAILSTTGQHLDTRSFPTTTAGIDRALDWVGRRTGGDQDTLWIIEGIGTYGARLAGRITDAGYRVAEAPGMSKKDRNSTGKDDHIDASRIAAAVVPLDESRLRTPRQATGTRQAIRILITARESMAVERTRAINALAGLVRANDLGVDARRKLSIVKVRTIARWRARREDIEVFEARREAVRLAKRVVDLDCEIKDYAKRVQVLVKESPAAVLLEQPGIGPITAAVIYTVWSHPGRIHSEAAFAKLAGTNPIPASSGNVVRFRLNRSGDRRLNSALYMVIITRLRHDKRTQAYMLKRVGQGKSKKETIRCLKRHLARNVWRILEAGQKIENAA